MKNASCQNPDDSDSDEFEICTARPEQKEAPIAEEHKEEEHQALTNEEVMKTDSL